VRALIAKDFHDAFTKVDAFLTPTSPYRIQTGRTRNDPLQMYLADIYTVTGSLAGLPGISVPCGRLTEMPVGMQILDRLLARRRCCNWHMHSNKRGTAL